MSNELTDAERMTKFETQLENLVLVVTRMEAKMDTWQTNFVSKELLEEKLKSRDEKIKQFAQVVEQLENDKKSNKHVIPLWAAVVVSVVFSIWSHLK